eukprot:gnl/TRDRNA2_/TRDRNA2_73088_c0_seq1.p1 gnl/TRDRNA2_/TRDRNA2_73088_c0~~gnl/TRDRNA2_/TRDRNA2_73088_c0_seq1.p1  ORF type:complete len:115 (-),score=6.59 gnl/TRDRNA2_/TRDRNA2_73088_c0_seq1:220-564(-)
MQYCHSQNTHPSFVNPKRLCRYCSAKPSACGRQAPHHRRQSLLRHSSVHLVVLQVLRAVVQRKVLHILSLRKVSQMTMLPWRGAGHVSHNLRHDHLGQHSYVREGIATVNPERL